MASTPIQIDRHQPERRRPPVTTLHCGCTCCCCCCLHTVGSIVGAAVAPTMGTGAPTTLTYYYDEETGEAVPDIRKPGGFSAVALFWWISCLLIVLGLALPILLDPRSPGGIAVSGIIMLMVFPAMQLASVVITLIIFAISSRSDKWHQLRQLGKVASGVVIGTILGVGGMVAIGMVFSLLK